MPDHYTARFPERLRAVFAGGSVLVSVPALIAAPVAALPVAVQAAALWCLGRRPGLGTAGVLVASAGLQLLVPAYGPGIAFVALCTYAWMRPASETLRMLPPAVLAVCGPAAAHGRWDLAGLWLGGVALAWSWGALARARAARRQAEQRQAVLEERARIARELHDVLSHTVSVMVVQAAAADDVFELNPAKAREAVRRTEEAGRPALAELRFFLRAVRGPESTESPQPTLADLDRLAGVLGEAGLPVTVVREGAARVPLGVQLGAYRIVQEALTNTLRHAHAGHAEVLLRLTSSQVYVRVQDDGAGPSGGPSGHGLLGMRERAELLGGSLTTGGAPDGGFEVVARLPLGTARPPAGPDDGVVGMPMEAQP